MRLRSGLEYTGRPTRIFCHCRLCSGRPNSEEFSPFKEDVVESVQQEIVQDEKKPNVEKKKLKTLRATMFVWSLLANMTLILGALLLVIQMEFAVNTLWLLIRFSWTLMRNMLVKREGSWSLSKQPPCGEFGSCSRWFCFESKLYIYK